MGNAQGFAPLRKQGAGRLPAPFGRLRRPPVPAFLIALIPQKARPLSLKAQQPVADLATARVIHLKQLGGDKAPARLPAVPEDLLFTVPVLHGGNEVRAVAVPVKLRLAQLDGLLPSLQAAGFRVPDGGGDQRVETPFRRVPQAQAVKPVVRAVPAQQQQVAEAVQIGVLKARKAVERLRFGAQAPRVLKSLREAAVPRGDGDGQHQLPLRLRAVAPAGIRNDHVQRRATLGGVKGTCKGSLLDRRPFVRKAEGLRGPLFPGKRAQGGRQKAALPGREQALRFPAADWFSVQRPAAARVVRQLHKLLHGDAALFKQPETVVRFRGAARAFRIHSIAARFRVEAQVETIPLPAAGRQLGPAVLHRPDIQQPALPLRGVDFAQQQLGAAVPVQIHVRAADGLQRPPARQQGKLQGRGVKIVVFLRAFIPRKRRAVQREHPVVALFGRQPAPGGRGKGQAEQQDDEQGGQAFHDFPPMGMVLFEKIRPLSGSRMQ